MDRYASSEVLNCMHAYYKVTIKSIIDNIATQAVETELVGKLRDLLSLARIIHIKPDLVASIAAESPDNRSQRERLTRKLVILQAKLESCKKRASRPTMNESGDEILYSVSDPEEVDAQEAIKASSGATAESKLFVFSGSEPVNPFSPQVRENREQKMECADSEKSVLSKKSKKKKTAK
ncbi:hypothetical protein BKA61DRAFT_568220 [Leptodontidium sp. MPI-SDFR-AT-0119]|nr:hypothetical protein BKA61DRAFT_568220 [Leptodontidium sp. MPI-SDFR-AT-0119]